MFFFHHRSATPHHAAIDSPAPVKRRGKRGKAHQKYLSIPGSSLASRSRSRRISVGAQARRRMLQPSRGKIIVPHVPRTFQSVPPFAAPAVGAGAALPVSFLSKVEPTSVLSCCASVVPAQRFLAPGSDACCSFPAARWAGNRAGNPGKKKMETRR